MAQFNLKISKEVDKNKPVFPALYKAVNEPEDDPTYELIVLALSEDQAYILRDSEEPAMEKTIDHGYQPFNDTKYWTRLPSGTVLEIIQD